MDEIIARAEMYGKFSKMYKKPLEVTFKGELGEDWGGLRKELFALVCKNIYEDEEILFRANPDTQLYWINGHCDFFMEPKEESSFLSSESVELASQATKDHQTCCKNFE